MELFLAQILPLLLLIPIFLKLTHPLRLKHRSISLPFHVPTTLLPTEVSTDLVFKTGQSRSLHSIPTKPLIFNKQHIFICMVFQRLSWGGRPGSSKTETHKSCSMQELSWTIRNEKQKCSLNISLTNYFDMLSPSEGKACFWKTPLKGFSFQSLSWGDTAEVPVYCQYI